MINKIKSYDNNNFFLIAGPCAIEDRLLTLKIAEKILSITNKLKIPFIFKGSFKKANRTRLDSFTGIGDLEALKILKEVGDKFNIPTITDVHTIDDISNASEYVDVLQIPAFLSRQTDLIVAAAKTGMTINIKKGQFISPDNMIHSINKVRHSGNKSVMITERGTMHGYRDIVVDYSGIPIMKSFGVPIILDITHSLQKPNQINGITGGNPERIETIAKAGIAVGVDGIFLETHPNPKDAKSDGANMLELEKLESLLIKLVKIKNSLI